jgi:hypothetical protein
MGAVKLLVDIVAITIMALAAFVFYMGVLVVCRE